MSVTGETQELLIIFQKIGSLIWPMTHYFRIPGEIFQIAQN